MKKKIGISYSTTNFSFYWDWFQHLEEIEPVLLSFEKNNEDEIATCSGFVLTGGIDINPKVYGGNENYPNKPGEYQDQRDRFEKKIYRYARENKIPVLGICRGFQLVNVLEGGSLIQDLGKYNMVHKKEAADKEHEVAVVRQSTLFEMIHQPLGLVNSAHHQGIDDSVLAPTLKASAYSFDDEKIIEAFEWKEKESQPFLLCVQWHPERMKGKEKNPFSQKLREQFLDAIKIQSR
jgi:putative glutamine amidotransferase